MDDENNLQLGKIEDAAVRSRSQFVTLDKIKDRFF
jgi:hypothetical protein